MKWGQAQPEAENANFSYLLHLIGGVCAQMSLMVLALWMNFKCRHNGTGWIHQVLYTWIFGRIHSAELLITETHPLEILFEPFGLRVDAGWTVFSKNPIKRETSQVTYIIIMITIMIVWCHLIISGSVIK